jgi:hypothetical protein
MRGASAVYHAQAIAPDAAREVLGGHPSCRFGLAKITPSRLDQGFEIVIDVAGH